MTVAFFGHRDTLQGTEKKLQEILISLIEDGARVFYVGNEGNFDRMVQRELAFLSKQYSNILCHIVLAYLPTQKSSETFSLETIYPEGLEKVPQKFAICKRNDWILSRVDTVVTHVLYPMGNSYELKLNAERKGKKVINIV